VLVIKALLNNWFNEKSIKLRDAMNISDSIGTAFIVQQMVFGNFNQNSGTGVCFSRYLSISFI
jgi:pyruvate,orthophosphate dikinase